MAIAFKFKFSGSRPMTKAASSKFKKALLEALHTLKRELPPGVNVELSAIVCAIVGEYDT